MPTGPSATLLVTLRESLQETPVPAITLDDPFDPAEFGDVFAKPLAQLADDPDAIDLEYGTHDVAITITMNGIDYLVRVSPVGATVED